jgi:hypothetical protein
MKSKRDTYDFLVACTQTDVNIKEVNGLIAMISDWEDVYDRASMHGVLPLVYQVLSDNIFVNEKVRLQFKAEAYNIARGNMIKSAELIKILNLFDHHHIDVIAFKGPTLSQILYGDVVTRHYSDLDLLVDKNSLYHAATLLLKSGFESTFPIKFLKNRTYLSVGKDIAFDNHQLCLHVELHWKLFEKKFIIKKSNFFNTYQKVSIYKQSMQTLDNEPLLLYLCIHGSKHFWERLEWIVDLDRLIRTTPNLNWEKILQEAVVMKSQKLFLFGLHVAYLFFKTPLPQNIYEVMCDDVSSFELAKRVKQFFKDDKINLHVDQPFDFESIEHMALVSDGKYGYFHIKLRSYFQLKEGDILLINLPYFLSWIYYFLRPFRLIWKVVYKLLRHDKSNEAIN